MATKRPATRAKPPAPARGARNDEQIAFRVPSELMAAIDREVERLRAERPGETVHRSDVIRAVLYRALMPKRG